MSNPFRYKGSLDPVEDGVVFISRQATVKQILRRIGEGAWVSILGRKKVGKSSLVNELIVSGREAHPDYCFFLVKMKDIDYREEGNLYRDVAAKIHAQARLSMPKLLPREQYDPEPATDFKVFLIELSRQLDDCQRIVLLLDGVEAIPEGQLQRFLQALGVIRSARTTEGFRKYIVIVSGAVHLVDIADPAVGPFSELSEVFPLHDFDREEAEGMVKRVVDGLGLKCDPTVPRLIADETGGTAYLVQKICFDIIERAVQDDHVPEFTLQNVAAVIDTIVERGEANFMWAMSRIQEKPYLVEQLMDVLERGRIEGLSGNRALRELEIIGAATRVGDAAVVRNRIYERAFRRRFTPEYAAELLFKAKEYEKARGYYQRALQEYSQRAWTLKDLSQTVRDISADLSLKSMFDRVLVSVKEIGSARLCSIMLLDKASRTLRIAAQDGYDDEYVRGFALKLGEGVAGRVAETGLKRAVHDVQDQTECPEFAYPAMASKKGVHAFVCIPLVFGGETLGVLNTYLEGDARFHDSDIAKLENLGSNLAANISNDRARRGAERFRAMLDTTLGAASLDMNAALGYILQSAQTVADTPRVYICYRDFETGGFEHATPSAMTIDRTRFADIAKGQGICSVVFKEGRSVYCPDVTVADTEPCTRYHRAWDDTRTDYATPIVLTKDTGERENIGVLNAESVRPDAFDESQRDLLTVLAVEAGKVLRAAWLYQELTARASELRAMREIEAYMLASDDIDEVLKQIGEKALQIVAKGRGRKHYFLFLHDYYRDQLVIRQEGGLKLAESCLGLEVPTQGYGDERKSIAALATREKRMVLFNSGSDPDAQSYLMVTPEFEQFKSAAAVPMIVSGKVIGVLNIESTEEGAFDKDDVELVRALAHKGAVALELITRRKQHEAMHNVIEAVVRNPPLDDLLSLIVDQAVEAIGGKEDRVFFVQTLDETRSELTVRMAKGADFSGEYTGVCLKKADGKGITWRAVNDGKVVLVSDVSKDPDFSPVVQEKVKSALAVPICFETTPLGVIGIESTKLHDFNEYDVRLIADLASHAGAAVHMEQLTKEIARTCYEMADAKHDLVLRRGIGELLHDIKNPALTLLDICRELFPKLLAAEQLTREYVDEQAGLFRKLDDRLTYLIDGVRFPKQELKRVQVAIDELVKDCCVMLRFVARARAVSIRTELNATGCSCSLDPHMMNGALWNIIQNAIEATEPDKRVTVSTSLREGGFVAVSVEDEGHGLDEETKREMLAGVPVVPSGSRGWGWGFFTARKVIEAYKGRVEIDKGAVGGTLITVLLPC